jgi:stress responsive alpha/beta barrel protein
MVTHIVIFTWYPGVDSEQVKSFRQALDHMATELEHLTVIRHGPDLRFRDTNGDYALVATFSDRTAWDAYQAHPVHKAFVRDCVTPIQASRVAIQF